MAWSSARRKGCRKAARLSPLLSNIVLDELDQELARRGHRFVRYADDCNIYVRSERAGRRVMASVTDFLERRFTHWKTKRTIARKLIRLGVKPKTARHHTYGGRTSRWGMSRNSAVHQGLRNAYYAERGLVSIAERWKQLAKYIGAPGEQLELVLG